mgnify:CR=1 FL=1
MDPAFRSLVRRTGSSYRRNDKRLGLIKKEIINRNIGNEIPVYTGMTDTGELSFCHSELCEESALLLLPFTTCDSRFTIYHPFLCNHQKEASETPEKILQ